MQWDLWHIHRISQSIQYSLHKSILIENVRGGKKIRRVIFLMFSFCPGWITMDSVASGWSKPGDDFFKGMLECIFTDKNSSIPGEGLRLWGDAVFSIPISTRLGSGTGIWGQNCPCLSLHIQILETAGASLTSAICSPSKLQEASTHWMRAWNEVLEDFLDTLWGCHGPGALRQEISSSSHEPFFHPTPLISPHQVVPAMIWKDLCEIKRGSQGHLKSRVCKAHPNLGLLMVFHPISWVTSKVFKQNLCQLHTYRRKMGWELICDGQGGFWTCAPEDNF